MKNNTVQTIYWLAAIAAVLTLLLLSLMPAKALEVYDGDELIIDKEIAQYCIRFIQNTDLVRVGSAITSETQFCFYKNLDIEIKGCTLGIAGEIRCSDYITVDRIVINE